MRSSKKIVPVKKSNRGVWIGIGVAVIAFIIIFLIVNGNRNPKVETTSAGENIIITKSDITETAKFIPYQVGNIKMEVVAVRAPDGSIRTAFNTCQVCFNSGRGYYKQEGNELVCQNCGNRFQISQVEKIKGGCNPLPILAENKTDDGTTITISKYFLAQNKDLFRKWKKE